MSALGNLDFETEGATIGSALGWTISTVSCEAFAGYNDPAAPDVFEGFEIGWDSNDDYLFAFDNPNVQLVAGQFATVHVAQKFVEDFEERWSVNETYFFAFAGEAGTFDIDNPQNVEDFETEWNTNELFVTEFIGTTGDFAAEDFESGWSSNGAYVTVFSGTAAVYQGSVAFDNFEANWDSMTSV